MRPYVAWLPSGCTGTLIAPDRVLTAGHCIDGAGPHGYAVIVGKDGNQLLEGGHDFFGTALANGVPVRGFSVHPRFREAFPFAYRSPINAIALDDVGLILLAQPVTGIAPLKLAGPVIARTRGRARRGRSWVMATRAPVQPRRRARCCPATCR